MKMTFMAVLATALFGLASCGSENSEKNNESASACKYNFDYGQSTLEWTAFKFTERKGVPGTFTEVMFGGIQDAETHKALIESLDFSIKTSSVETNDPGRNAKIAEYFFQTINTPELKGANVKLNGTDKISFDLTMNNQTKRVNGTYKLDGENFSMEASIDVLDWSAGNGIEALNQQCIENHTGADGVLKLWSEVDLKFSTKLQKTCK